MLVKSQATERPVYTTVFVRCGLDGRPDYGLLALHAQDRISI